MELRLLQDHTRAGIELSKGTVIDVPESKVAWFINNKVAEKSQIILPSIFNNDQKSESSKPQSSSHKKRGRKNC